MSARHVYVLRMRGPVTDIDAWASALWLMSRGRRPVRGSEGRAERDALADLLEGTTGAPLLASDRPLVVEAVGHGYEFWEG